VEPAPAFLAALGLAFAVAGVVRGVDLRQVHRPRGPGDRCVPPVPSVHAIPRRRM